MLRLTSHQDPGHVFIASWNDDHPVKVVAPSSALDLIGNKVAGLQRVRHSASPHAYAIADTDRAELVSNDARIAERSLDFLAKSKKMFVASVTYSTS